MQSVSSNAVAGAIKNFKNVFILTNTTHQYGNQATSQTIFTSYDLTDLKLSSGTYICVLRCGGASNSSYHFVFTLTISYNNWSFSIASQSSDKGSLTFDTSTNILTMTVLNKTQGLYKDRLYVTVIDGGYTPNLLA